MKVESEREEISWRQIGIDDIYGNPWGIVQKGAWRGSGEFEWQLLHRALRPSFNGLSERPPYFELVCFELGNLGGFQQNFSTIDEAVAEVNRIDAQAKARRKFLGDAGTRAVVLWPDSWEIIDSSESFGQSWTCPYCEAVVPAYKVEVASNQRKFWICSMCSMPFEWRESPDRLHLSAVELDRLEAKDLEREWGLGTIVVDDRHFFIEDPVRVPAVHSLRHVWLPPYLTTRTVLCCEESPEGDNRWLTFVNDRERLIILVEASESRRTHLGYFVDFGTLGGVLDLIESWDCEEGWVDQLPSPQEFWFEDGAVRAGAGIDLDTIGDVLAPQEARPD